MVLKRLFLTMLIAALSGAAIVGCNTVRGAGQDIEEGGEAIQGAAEEVAE